MVFVAHIFLLLLIREEDADFGNVGGEEAVENGVAASDYGGVVLKSDTVNHLFYLCLPT